MKKKIIIPVAIILVIALIPTIIIMRKSGSSQGSLSSASKMETALKTINKNLKDTLPSLEVTTIDTKDAELVSSYTYLSNPSVVESLVVSEPLITSQAYLAILLKVKDTANVETVKEELLNNLNMNRWICVSAEKLYITNNGNTIFAVMASNDWATPVYEEFVKYVDNNIGKTLDKNDVDMNFTSVVG